MPTDHDWHLFDAEKNYFVKREGEHWLVKREDETIFELTHEQFDQLRNEGVSPEGLE
jgi:hypothetical protein